MSRHTSTLFRLRVTFVSGIISTAFKSFCLLAKTTAAICGHNPSTQLEKNMTGKTKIIPTDTHTHIQQERDNLLKSMTKLVEAVRQTESLMRNSSIPHLKFPASELERTAETLQSWSSAIEDDYNHPQVIEYSDHFEFLPKLDTQKH